jgi:hypothetical protein
MRRALKLACSGLAVLLAESLRRRRRHQRPGGTSGGIRCAYMMCDAQPSPAEVAKLEAEEAQRRATRIEVPLEALG